MSRYLKETSIKSKMDEQLIINIQDEKVFKNIPIEKRILDLNVSLSKIYDKNKDDSWNYKKTFKRYEKYSNNFDRSILN